MGIMKGKNQLLMHQVYIHFLYDPIIHNLIEVSVKVTAIFHPLIKR